MSFFLFSFFVSFNFLVIYIRTVLLPSENPSENGVSGSSSNGQWLVEREDWIAAHVLDFFNEICVIYGTVRIFVCCCWSVCVYFAYFVVVAVWLWQLCGSCVAAVWR